MKLNDLPATDAALEPQAISIDVLLEKYAKGNESSIEDVQRRVSLALCRRSRTQSRPRALVSGVPLPRCVAASCPPAESTRQAARTSVPR